MGAAETPVGGTSYSTRRAALLADQLERLATQNPHQLAGQAANLDFWISEVESALRTIAEYAARLRRLRDAQGEWVQAHGTRVSGYCAYCGGACELGPAAPAPPRRVPSEELSGAASAVRAGLRRFLLRLHRLQLLDEAAVRSHCDRLDIGVEREDFARPRERRG